MGNLSVGGLMTGFDTKGVVEKLMAVERLAGNRIVTAKTGASALSGALTQLNGHVGKLGDAAKAVLPDAIMKTSVWSSATAASTNKEVATATASGTSVAAQLDVRVDAVAQAGAAMTGEIAVADRNTAVKAAPWSLTITNHGKDATLDFGATDTLNTIAEKINAHKDADVTAAVVKVRDGAYRLQLTSKTTGADTTLQFSGDTDVVGGLNELRKGGDTKVTVGAGSAAEFSVTSKTTKVEGLMEGVSITALKEGQTTISAQRDPGAIADKIAAMVDAANAALTNVRINSKVDPNLKKAEAGKDSTNNSGLFMGNSTAADVTRRISDVFVGSSSNIPSVAGLNIAKDGTVSFDRAKFTEAYAKDPVAIEKNVTDTAQKLADVSKSLTNSTDGTLTVAIRGQDALVKDYSDQIKRFEDRMTAKQDILNRQYDALDKMLSKLKAQGDWLTGQLKALSGPSKD